MYYLTAVRQKWHSMHPNSVFRPLEYVLMLLTELLLRFAIDLEKLDLDRDRNPADITGNIYIRIQLPRSLIIHNSTFICKNGVVKPSPPSAAYMRQWTGSALIQIMACQLDSNFSDILIKMQNFSFMKMHLKYRLLNCGHIAKGETS